MRDAVIDLLEATIATMSQDLHLLLDELMDLTEPSEPRVTGQAVGLPDDRLAAEDQPAAWRRA